MITEISIRKTASYDDNGAKLAGLKKINFVFGANGTGKTTISRIIAGPQDKKYSDCQVTWQYGIPLKALVYNRDFVAENFNPQTDIKGIFTLGKQEADTQEKIKATEKALSDIGAAIGCKNNEKSEKDKELKKLDEKFNDILWQEQKKYEKDFRPAFKNLGTKGNNREKFLEEYKRYKDTRQAALTLETLKERAQTIFDKNAEKIPLVCNLDQGDIDTLNGIANELIFQEKVIGKGDVPIAALIRKLDNSGWIQQGVDYMRKTESICPFCQQNMAPDLQKEIEDVFDENYKQKIMQLERWKQSYAIAAERVNKHLRELFATKNSTINHEKLGILKEKVSVAIEENANKIQEKLKNPDKVIQLRILDEVLREANDFLGAVDDKVKEHNELIDDRKTEEKKLIANIWAFLASEKKADIVTYNNKMDSLRSEISKISQMIEGKKENQKDKADELKELQKNLTSVQPTVGAINGILKGYGFTNFSLATDGDKKEFYKIIRPDGSEAKETLSEGERSFIAFLYFYHLIKGSHSADGNQVAEVIVFDDPVSSLDSNVLFIVCELIRTIITENKLAKSNSNQGNIKQIFILTHNVYFHKQVSNALDGEICFYRIHKNNNQTIIECNNKRNTITNSYECLWNELRFLRDTRDRSSFALIQNVMRRILEYYFEDMQGKKKEMLVKDFSEEERRRHGAFIRWLHAGSHKMPDEDYYSADGDIDSFLLCFEMLFEKNDQKEHYQRMINRS